mgnify:CR=1 FL=1
MRMTSPALTAEPTETLTLSIVPGMGERTSDRLRRLRERRQERELLRGSGCGCSNGSCGSGVGNSGDNGVGLLDLNLVVFAV